MGSTPLALLKEVIQKSHDCIAKDTVSRALFFFLLRVANTWQSIKTLRKYSPDDKLFMVDAAALLRAMLDACFQAEYIVNDPDSKVARANDYLEYKHVERYKIFEKICKHDNWLSRRLKSSTKRPEGEKKNLEEYNRVKHKFFVQQKRCDKTRNTWYSGSLFGIAKNLGKEAEYDTFIANFNGCVHSNALAVQDGPPMTAQHVLTFASNIAARVARLNVQHNHIDLGDVHSQIMDELCKDFFENDPEK